MSDASLPSQSDSVEFSRISIPAIAQVLHADNIPYLVESESALMAVSFPAFLEFQIDRVGNLTVTGRWYRTLAGKYGVKAREACAQFNRTHAGPGALTTMLDNGQVQVIARQLVWTHPAVSASQLRAILHDAINQFKDLSTFLDDQFVDPWKEGQA
ncbi:hypothetical protein BSR29_03645 [Boudabousia liubingyangii]|uniref:YbjN domain-containing protein n=1 Tax=Boudabousia liubingyangii TaxID=1921764 RepID=A0A1Q5PNA1_9ACTO|nr:hypothetical protein [Boudabousia liubingyangii]OKL47521.1 hypothetical protein BSR28_03215 [Boudabousia liubingyangii]OKL48945.1 hypothetical protein BSR29_03645 [Boudabousia liubingyangii]